MDEQRERDTICNRLIERGLLTHDEVQEMPRLSWSLAKRLLTAFERDYFSIAKHVSTEVTVPRPRVVDVRPQLIAPSTPAPITTPTAADELPAPKPTKGGKRF